MHKFAIAVLCLMATNMAMADPPSSADTVPVITQASMKSYPPLDKIFASAKRYGHRISTSVAVAYDQAGNVLTVKLNKPTGDKFLDQAILAWAAMVKIQADGPGSGNIPIKIGLGG